MLTLDLFNLLSLLMCPDKLLERHREARCRRMWKLLHTFPTSEWQGSILSTGIAVREESSMEYETFQTFNGPRFTTWRHWPPKPYTCTQEDISMAHMLSPLHAREILPSEPPSLKRACCGLAHCASRTGTLKGDHMLRDCCGARPRKLPRKLM